MQQIIEGLQQKKYQQRLQKKSTFQELEIDYENEQQEQEDQEKKETVVKQKSSILIEKIKQRGSMVQIDDIMLFYLSAGLSDESLEIITKNLKRAKLFEKKIKQITSQLKQDQMSLIMISSLLNYALSLKNIKLEKLKQYQQWNEEFPCQVVVRNDGNCYYRSFLIKYMLSVIFSRSKDVLEKFIHTVHNLPPLQYILQDNTVELTDEEIKQNLIIFFTKNFQKHYRHEMFSVLDFIREYNQAPALDLCSNIIIRNIIYQFYQKVKKSGHYQGWIQNFERDKNHKLLITMGKDAEQQIMILSSQALETKVFALTFYQDEQGKIASKMNEQYMQQGDFNQSVYVLYTNDHYNILFEREFVENHSNYFMQFIEFENSQQQITYFDKNGVRSIQANKINTEDQQQEDSEVMETNFFKRLQLQEPEFFKKEYLLEDFGFKRQINVLPLEQNMFKSNLWELQGEDGNDELPQFNPLAMQQEFQMDFQTYLDLNQLSKIDSIAKKKDSEDHRDIHSLNQELKEKPVKKRVRVSMHLEQIDSQEFDTMSQPSQTKIMNTPDQKLKSIYKKPTLEQLSQLEIKKKQSDINEVNSDQNESISDSKSDISHTSVNKQDKILKDIKCMDCDKITSIKDNIIVTDVYKGVKICNKCVEKSVNYMKENKLTSIRFYNIEVYRFQMIGLMRDLEDTLAKSTTSFDERMTSTNFLDDNSLELIEQNEAGRIKVDPQIQQVIKKNSIQIQDQCVSCSRIKKDSPLQKEKNTFFLEMQNYDNSQGIIICKRCLFYYFNDASKSKYLTLMKIGNTFVSPQDIIKLYNKQISDQNKTGELINCQFYCKLEENQKSISNINQKKQKKETLASDLYDTDENPLLSKKICIQCFEQILLSQMSVDDLIPMPCQIKLFSIVFKEDFLNDICISCNTSQFIGKKNINRGQTISQDSNTLFRVIENVEKFDSFVCITCIKNLLIDQYIKNPSNKNEGEQEEQKLRIGVLFQFTYSNFINNQILLALKNEVYKNQACFKCLSKLQQPIYFLNNPENNSICQSCFLLISQHLKKQDLVQKLNISEFQYRIIKEGTLQNLFENKQCFCCTQKQNQVYNIWVKDYTRVQLICNCCLKDAKVYCVKDLFEITLPNFEERVLFQSIDVPLTLLPIYIDQDSISVHQKEKEEKFVKIKSYKSLNDLYHPCILCSSGSRKAIQMKNCSCWLCLQCISKYCTADTKDFMICPSPHCIQKYMKINIITYIDELVEDEVKRNQQKLDQQKINRQNSDKFVCNQCRDPHSSVVLTKQKYCSCVLLCKKCLLTTYQYKQCLKCLEMPINITKGDIDFFDDNSLCPSCLEPLNLDQKSKENSSLNINKNFSLCDNCLFQVRKN